MQELEKDIDEAGITVMNEIGYVNPESLQSQSFPPAGLRRGKKAFHAVTAPNDFSDILIFVSLNGDSLTLVDWIPV